MKYEKSCGAVVFDGDKVLIVKHQAGHVDFPKGHMEKGETEEETAIREVKEETNIDIMIVGNRYVVTYSPKENVMKDVIFFVAQKKYGNIIAQESEVSEVKWVDKSEVLSILTFDNAKELFQKVMKDIEKNC